MLSKAPFSAHLVKVQSVRAINDSPVSRVKNPLEEPNSFFHFSWQTSASFKLLPSQITSRGTDILAPRP